MATFYSGQSDYIEKLNELASLSDLLTIPSNIEAAEVAADAATSAAAAAAISAASANTEANNALSFANTAQDWAIKVDAPVSAGEYSSKYWAQVASATVGGGIIYKGTWSAAGGTYPTSPSTGWLYKISVAGTISGTSFAINDSIIYNGTVWSKIASTDSVTSVAGKTGTVTLVKADVGLSNVDNTSDLNKPVSTATSAALDLKAPVATTVTAVTGTGPIVSSGGLTPAISIPAASASVNGYMSSTYAAKLDSVALNATANLGTVTGVTATAPIASTGGVAPVISMPAATSITPGYMTAAQALKLDNIAEGATASGGSVSSVTGTGTVSGLTLTGTVTSAGSLTLGGTLSVAASNFGSQSANTFLAAPNGSAGTPTFRSIIAADIPTLNQNTSGSAATLTTARSINGVNFNGSANITVPSLYDANYRRITNPGGAEYVTTTASVTGAIAITLPVGMTGTMLSFSVKVYNYVTNESFEVRCGGYNFGTGNTWVNAPFAYIVGNPGVDRRFTVRFGYTSGLKAVVYIGELGSVWSRPQVFVTDVQLGFGGSSATWVTGWNISFVTAAFENVTATVSTSQVGYATSTNTTGAIVLRDGSGNFSAGAITGTSFNSITGLSSTTPVVAGTAAVGVGTTAARGDHVHPAQTSVTGNAGTVTVVNDIATNSDMLIGWVAGSSGSQAVKVSNGNRLSFNPSTGKIQTFSPFSLSHANNRTNFSAIVPNTDDGSTVNFPVAKYAWHDQLAFGRIYGDPIFEKFTGTWNSATLNNTIFSQKEDISATIIDGITETACRWTWNSNNIPYAYTNYWLFGFTYVGVTAPSKNILIETSPDGVVWTTRHTSSGITTQGAAQIVYVSNWSSETYIRLTITITNSLALKLSTIRALTMRWGDQGKGSEYSFPYSWDADQRIAIGKNAVVSANAQLVIGTNTTASTGGLLFGTDTYLYRSAAQTLHTTNSFGVGSALTVGSLINSASGIEIGYQGGAAQSAFIDFHSGATLVDFDARIISSGGTGSNNGGTLTISGATIAVSGALTASSTIVATGQITGPQFNGPVTALKSATTAVSISSADAPTTGQVLTATGGTAATWQTPAGPGNLTGPITSVGLATSVASQTGTGSTFVMNTSPTLVTPVIGAATGTSLLATGEVSGGYLGVENTVNTNGYGISLYNGGVAGQPSYGFMFQGTATFGTYGPVTGDWATYLTMNTTVGRGWIFKGNTGALGNVVGISNTGVAEFAGAVTAAALIPSGATVPANGLYLPAASTVAISTGTTERMRIDSAGNLGVGTAIPSVRFEVARLGSDQAIPNLNAITAVLVTAGGGTTTSGAAITLAGGNAAFTGLFFGDVDDGSMGALLYDNTTNSIQFRVNGVTERMLIDSNGFVGIGTSTPTALLTVSSDVATAAHAITYSSALATTAANINVRRWRGTASAPSAVLADDTLGAYIFNGGTGAATSSNSAAITGFASENYSATNSGSYITLSTTTTGTNGRVERMRIDAAGNLGVGGTATGGRRIHAKDTNCIVTSEGTSGYGSFYANGSGTNSSYMFFGSASVETARIRADSDNTLVFLNTSSATGRMWIGATGNVGIGAASTTHILEVTKNQNAATALVVRNTDAGASVKAILQLTNGTKFSNISLDPTGNYVQHSASGGVVSKYVDFDNHFWRNNAGTTNATLNSTGEFQTRSGITSRTSTTSDGFVALKPGSATNSGYIEFFSHTSGNRQGYIGFASTNAATNQGTIPYVASVHAFAGQVTIGTDGSTGALFITDTNSGTGANIRLTGNGATTPSKYLRVNTGVFQVINNAYSAAVLELTDAGALSVAGSVTGTQFTGPVTALKSATTTVSVSSAAAPTTGQVLTATSSTTATWQSVASAPRGYIDGLIMSTAGSSTTMTVAAGVATDSTAVTLITLTASIAKTTSAWVVGTTAGGLDTGTIAANTWYHFYLIRRTDTGVVDVLVSLSATSPTMPASYTQFRRIGAGRTNASSQWASFTQIGDNFVWITPALDINTTTLSTTTTLYTLSVPSGISVVAHINAFMDSGSTIAYLYLNSPSVNDESAIDNGRISLSGGYNTLDTVNRFPSAGQFNIVTNTSGQIQAVANSSGTIFKAATIGWTDPRGENA